MNAFRLLTCLIITVTVVACSNHWREANSGLTAQEMAVILAEVEQSSAQAGGSGSLTEALALKDDPNASIYFADAPSPIGQVPNVLGFFNYEFLGLGDIGYRDISEARVIFFDAPQTDGSRLAALIIGIKQVGQDVFTYYAFSGTASIDGSDYEANLGNIIVKSFDASEGGLDDVIQLKVYEPGGGYLGKVATLVGFKN